MGFLIVFGVGVVNTFSPHGVGRRGIEILQEVIVRVIQGSGMVVATQ